jgi:hypothetical protein
MTAEIFNLIQKKLNLSPIQAQVKIEDTLRFISLKPVPENHYNIFYTFPGFENYKNHKYPIIKFNSTDSCWELDLNTNFNLYNNLKKD